MGRRLFGKRVRDRIVTVRLTEDEQKTLQNMADSKGLDMSDILRLPVVHEMNRLREAVAS